MRRVVCSFRVVVVAVLSSLLFGAVAVSGGEGKQKPTGKYVGARACKNCHQSEKTGAQYKKWFEMKHARAYKVLKTPEARKVATQLGVTGDPQKSPKCLKCHVTAHGVDPKRLAKKFKVSDGVQCESCHGPGEKHQKARLVAAMQAEDEGEIPDEPIPLRPGELPTKVEEETCVKCHNPESPSYVEFKFEEFKEKIAHPDPRKKKGAAKAGSK